MTGYSDEQMRQELIGFFGWRDRDVRRLTASELAAWKRHALALRTIGFWWFTA
jgi:hypothetical protein